MTPLDKCKLLSSVVCENTFLSSLAHAVNCFIGLALWENLLQSIMTQLLFVLIQIDYQTFLTLSDDDLKEVGVSTFGARRKMLMAISGENLMYWLLDLLLHLLT